MSCPRCDAPAEGTRYCTRCGTLLEAGEGDSEPDVAPATAGPLPDLTLVACPACGATNAPSRARCGRCHVPLDATSDEPYSRGVPWEAPPEAVADAEPGLPRALVAVTLVAVVAVAAVVIALLGSRGSGWFAPSEAMSPLAASGELVEVVGVRASSELAGSERSFGPASNAVDGDPETAWVEGVGGVGIGEWLELELGDDALVARVVVWNGYQRGELFEVSNRVASLRIDAGGRTFTGDLLDRRGPQAVDLPEPVRADTVRLVVERVTRGERGIDTALSEVEVYGDSAG